MAQIENQSSFPESTGPEIFSIPTLYPMGMKSPVSNPAARAAEKRSRGAIKASKISLVLLTFNTSHQCWWSFSFKHDMDVPIPKGLPLSEVVILCLLLLDQGCKTIK